MTQVKNAIKDNYNMMLLNDFLREEIKESGFIKLKFQRHLLEQRLHFMLQDLELL